MDTTTPPFEFETAAERSILTLNSRLNEVQWGDVESVGSEILRRMESIPSPALLVDLSKLDYMGSAQVALLVRVWKWLKHRNGRLVVQLAGPTVREVLTIAGLHTLWDIVDTREAAFGVLGLQPDGRRPQLSVAGPLTGVMALFGAAISFCIPFFPRVTISPQLLVGLQFGFSAVALLAGAVTVIRGTGLRRGLGVGIVVAGVLLTVMKVLALPK